MVRSRARRLFTSERSVSDLGVLQHHACIVWIGVDGDEDGLQETRSVHKTKAVGSKRSSGVSTAVRCRRPTESPLVVLRITACSASCPIR
jgi:hypothetical protein